MKKLRLIALLGILLVSTTLVGCDKDKETNTWDIIIEDITASNEVINYNDSLVDITSQCIISESAVWDAWEAYEAWETSEINAALSNSLYVCRNAMDEINKLGGWEGDDSLKDWVLKVIEKDIAYFEKFSELLPFLEDANAEWELPDELAASYEAVVADLEALDAELEEANSELVQIQEAFATNHGYELQPEDEAE